VCIMRKPVSCGLALSFGRTQYTIRCGLQLVYARHFSGASPIFIVILSTLWSVNHPGCVQFAEAERILNCILFFPGIVIVMSTAPCSPTVADSVELRKVGFVATAPLSQIWVSPLAEPFACEGLWGQIVSCEQKKPE